MANEVDEFLSQVKGETKGDPFLKDESDPLGTKKEDEGTTENDEAADEGKDEKPVPFHKDPKVQRYIQKEIAKGMKTQPSPSGQRSAREEFIKDTGSETDELTDSLVEIVGNDTPQKVAAVKKLRAQLEGLKRAGAEEALNQLREQANAEAEAEAEAVEEISTAFEALEEEYDVDLTSNTTAARKERNDFIDFIKRVSPKDENGTVVQYPDFDETWKLYQGTKKPADNRRAKDISSRSMSRSTDASSQAPTGKTWKDIDRIFSKLN